MMRGVITAIYRVFTSILATIPMYESIVDSFIMRFESRYPVYLGKKFAVEKFTILWYNESTM